MSKRKKDPVGAKAQRIVRFVDREGYTTLAYIAKRCQVTREYVRQVLTTYRPGLYARAQKARLRTGPVPPVIAS